MKRNHLITSHFGGGNSVFTGLTSIFHTSTKRRLLSCQRAIIAVFFAFFASGCSKEDPSDLLEDPSETAPSDTIVGGSFDFDITDDDTIEVDLNPGYSSYCPSYKLKEDSSGNRNERDVCVVSNAACCIGKQADNICNSTILYCSSVY